MKKMLRVSVLCVLMAGCGFITYSYQFQPLLTPPASQQPAWNATCEVTFAPEGITVHINNQGSESINVLWDECAYIDPNHTSHRVLTSSARRLTSQLAQAPTPIAPETNINEVLVPADYVEENFVKTLFPINAGAYGTWMSGYTAPVKSLIGKDIGLLLVLERNGEKRKQTFHSQIANVTP